MRVRVGAAGLAILAMAIISGKQLMSGQAELPVATGEPAVAKLPADKEASQVAFETATFGMG